MVSTTPAEQFAYHRQTYEALRAAIQQAQDELEGHRVVMFGLTKLDPSLDDEYRRVISRSGRVISMPTGTPSVVGGSSAATAPEASTRWMEDLHKALGGRRKRWMTVSEVAERLGTLNLDRGPLRNTRRALDRAVEVGLAQKEPDPNDRRANRYLWLGPSKIEPGTGSFKDSMAANAAETGSGMTRPLRPRGGDASG